MRLIDADRIVYSWHIDADGEEHDGVTLQSIIKKMPTIDAVEVVRCKDCKEYKYCFLLPNDDDYCSKGERREE